MDDLKLLPNPEKKVVAKVLYEKGYSSTQIEEFLGISDDTVIRAAKNATPEQLSQFEEEFRQRIKEMKQTGIGLVQKRLLELIPKERRIDQVVKAGEFLEGRGQGTNINVSGEKVIAILGDVKVE